MKKLLLICALLWFAACANGQTKKTNLGLFTNAKGTSQIEFMFTVIDSTKKVIDTVYSVSDNKPYRVTTTQYKTIDSTLIAIRVKEIWRKERWSFYSCSYAPVELESPYGISISQPQFWIKPNFNNSLK